MFRQIGKRFTLLGTIFIIATTNAVSQEIQLWDKASYDLKRESPNEDYFTNHSEIKVERELFDSGFHYGAEIDLFYNRGYLTDQTRSDIRLYETYYQHQSDDYATKIGYQIVRWGKTDEISPFDIITAEDFRDGFVRPRAQRKIATPMIQMNRYFDDSTFELVIKPVFQSDKYTVSDSDWAYLGNNRGSNQPVVDIQSPEFSFDTMAIGGRYSFQTAGIDLSLDMYSGLASSPIVTPTGFSAPGGLPNFAARYERINLVGIESSTDIDEFVVRGDLMLTIDEAMMSKQYTIERGEFLRYVVGIERQFESELFINLQFGQLLRVSSDYQSDQLMRNTEGIFTFFHYPVITNETTVGLRSFLNTGAAAGYTNPYLIYHDRGDWNIEIGADLFYGDFSLFNQTVSDNSQGYLILNYKL